MTTMDGSVPLNIVRTGKEEEVIPGTENSGAGEGDRPKVAGGGSVRESFNLFSSYFRERGRDKEGFGDGRASVDAYANQMAQLGRFLKHNTAFAAAPSAPITQPSRSAAAQLQPPPQNGNHPPQLTIFYGGTVNVFDDIPAEKVQAIMMLAAASAVNLKKNVEEPTATTVPALTRSPSVQSTSNQALAANLPNPTITVPLCKSQSDLPIARRNSFQRFLEKRRDSRLASKAPYCRAMNEGDGKAAAEMGRNQLGCFPVSEMTKRERPADQHPSMNPSAKTAG